MVKGGCFAAANGQIGVAADKRLSSECELLASPRGPSLGHGQMLRSCAAASARSLRDALIFPARGWHRMLGACWPDAPAAAPGRRGPPSQADAVTASNRRSARSGSQFRFP
jgi:hypothetical protein